jgi:hypothetical protein
MAGVGGLELRNVIPKYPFEKSHRFSVIQPNSGRRDYSRSSCDGGRRSSGLVPGSRQDACAGRNCRNFLPMPRCERVPRLDHHGFARSALAATSLETIHFGPEYCRRALSPEEGGEWGDGNERTGDEASSRRERSETADGRRNPGHRKGSGSRREDSLQGRGGHNRDGIHLALERVLMIRVARQAPADVRFALLRGRREDILEVRVHAIS